MNAVWLPMVAAANGWTSGVWATYRGWQRHGAQVRRGERGTHVVLWKPTTDNSPDSHDDDNNDSNGPRRRLLARAYVVFAAEQADGTDAVLERRAAELADRDTPERIATADAYFAAVAARVVLGGNRACYQPTTDTICLPDLDQFDQAAHFYATSAHEHVHWTGHPARLARDLTGRFGSDASCRRRTRRRTRRRHVVRPSRHQRHHPTRSRCLPRPLAPRPAKRPARSGHRRRTSPSRRRPQRP